VANKQLKAQVALKTDQLRHQSRILLTTNQQLRKQLQVKNVLVECTAEALTDDVTQLLVGIPDWEEKQASPSIAKLQAGLAQLKNSQPINETGVYCYDLLFILNAVLSAWREELVKAGVELELKVLTNQQFVNLPYFNLDVVFNSFIANVLKRTYRNQRLTIIFDEIDEKLSVTFLDYGAPLPKQLSSIVENVHGASADLNIEKLPLLMQQSGGELNIFVSDSQNKIQLLWPMERKADIKALDLAKERVELVEVQRKSQVEQELPTLTADEEWLNKVRHIIAEYYSDPDFGTSSAAKLLYVSERSLQRRFKSVTDRTFKDYLNEIRLEKACERLLSGAKIADVAFDSGFNDPSYFSQKFKHHFGVSPSKFTEDSLS